VTSTLSSAERTGENASTTRVTTSATTTSTRLASRVVATPRLLAGDDDDGRKRAAEDTISVSLSKKSGRSSKEVHRLQANIIMQTRKESMAMKMATTRIVASKALSKGHTEKKSINCIVKEGNEACNSNISPKTAGTYVVKGRINTSLLKRGPTGSFTKSMLESLKWAYASYLQLEQAEALTQSSIKDMSKQLNACVNQGGFTK